MEDNNFVDEYILTFDIKIQEKLQQLLKIIKEEAPEAKICKKYNMPAFVLNGNLVYFAAYKNHIGFYSISNTPQVFESEFRDYKVGKGSVQFPLNKPLPEELIRKIVRYRVDENS
ncbi:MAG: iron chaperone [Peptostreptococcaceae bacterium]